MNKKNEIKEIKSSFNEKFDEQNNKFDVKFNEINVKLMQQLDKLGRNIENKSEILLNKRNGDMLSNSCSDNQSRKLVPR